MKSDCGDWSAFIEIGRVADSEWRCSFEVWELQCMGEATKGNFTGNDRFEIVCIVGSGAMGLVYEAHDREKGLGTAPVSATPHR